VTSLFAAVRSPTSVSCGWDGGLSCFLTSPVCGQRSLFSVSNTHRHHRGAVFVLYTESNL